VLTYLGRRAVAAAIVFLAVTMSTFIVFFVIPTSAGTGVRRRQSEASIAGPAELSGPVYQQYGQFLSRIVTHGYIGRSTKTRQDVRDMIEQAAPVTISLVTGGVIVWLLIAIPVGILSALRPRSLLDRVGMLFVLVGVSAHPLWIGLMFSYFFGFKLGIAPANAGYCDLFNPQPGAECGGPVQWFYHLILPWVTFAMLFAALYTRMIRAKVAETLNEDYVRTARAKGASEWRVMRSHVLRNAMLPVVTMLGMDMGLAVGSVLFVEKAYGLPGLGGMAYDALVGHDLAVVIGIVVVVTMAIIALNFVVDVLYGWIDPRVRVVHSAGASDGTRPRGRGRRERQPVPESVPQSATL
jgi:peptide/nickel transport system permease protein